MSTPGALKVLHVAETLPGGIATYLRELIPLHVERPDVQEIRVLAPQGQLSHLQELPAAMLHGYARSGRNLHSFWNLVKAIRAQVAEFQPHIVHLHSSFAGVIGRLLRPWLPKRLRLVYCPHGWAFSRDDSRVSRQIYIWIERCLAKRADAWIAISQHEQDAALAVGIHAQHARLIYNGVSDTKNLPVLPFAGFDPAYLNLLFVGRHDRQKGLDILLSAMARLTAQKVRLYVAGAGVIYGAIKQGNSDNIVWLGWLSGEELIAYYRACDALVMPSRWEGLGLTALEAMREGRPVLAANRGALPEVVGDSGVLFEAEDNKALAALLGSLNKPQLAQWGKRARDRYLEHFQSQRMSDELMALYQQLRMQDSKTA